MAVNKNYRKKEIPVLWDGETLATVTALGADDIGNIMASASGAVAELLSTWEEGEFALKGKKPEEMADAILDVLPGIVKQLLSNIPELVAAVIAQAAGDDDPEAARVISEEWSFPAQMEGLACVARATFVDDTAFRAFVGNVVALLGSANALTANSSAKPKTGQMPRGPQSLVDG